MSAAAVKTAALEARIAALEALVAKIQADGLVPLAQETQRAHARLDAAARAFRVLSPKRETPPRLAPAAWDRALADLRDEAGDPAGWHSREAVYARHVTLCRMEAQQRTAEDEMAG